MHEQGEQANGGCEKTPNIMDGEVEENNNKDSIDIVDVILPNNNSGESPTQRIFRKSSRLRSIFRRKRSTESNHSSHPMQRDAQIPNATLAHGVHNSEHAADLTEMFEANFGSAMPSTADVTRMLQANTLNEQLTSRNPSVRSNISGDVSTAESYTSSMLTLTQSSICSRDELTKSMTILQSLGGSPSDHELDRVAALRAKEIIDECFTSKARAEWDSIPHFLKADLVVGQFLGRGTYSDVFEVFATVVKTTPTLESLGSDRKDLNKLIDARFPRKSSLGDISEYSSSGTREVEGGDLSDRGDHDDEINALFGSTTSSVTIPPLGQRTLSGSVCLGNIGRTSGIKQRTHKVAFAMKCLRPQIRSDAKQFIIGVEDLVHESAMLASLDHPNIVKIHGRAGGSLTNSYRLGDGFFILLDRLEDTLNDRILRWKKSRTARSPPSLSQIKTACSIANAMAYLHDKMIVFRDLKSANVGFDSSGVLKLFDFGFAICTAAPESSSLCSDKLNDGEKSHLLYDKCGTLRYMAPEIALETGYGLPADVYSFGILFWEICALKKPFSDVASADKFHDVVFVKGTRPKLDKYCPQVLRDIMTRCWSISAADRPDMRYVMTMLAAFARDASMRQNDGNDNLNLLHLSLKQARRFTG